MVPGSGAPGPETPRPVVVTGASAWNVNSDNPPRPLIVGEVLFDCFADHRVLGGAPFNVAWNLRGLGLDPLLVSAIGEDAPGHEVRQAMEAWGLDVSALQVRSDHATGRVDVTLQDGEPSYQFWEDVAFDHLQPPPEALLGERTGLLYHGSLVFRSPQVRRSIAALKRSGRWPVFVDVNIRQPYFEDTWVSDLIGEAEHVKLNLDELRRLAAKSPAVTGAQAGAAADSDAARQTWRHLARSLQRVHRIKNVWITAGQQGAAWVGPAGEFQHVPAAAADPLVDTVGAGDAFAAMIIRGLLRGDAPIDSLRAAADFAARVCGLRGATVADPLFYSL